MSLRILSKAGQVPLLILGEICAHLQKDAVEALAHIYR